MKLHFYGAARCVSGSCYLLETEKHKILVDCGMFQGSRPLKRRNYEDFAFDVNSIDAVLLTHAHIDHSGLLPKLYKAGYRKPIYATKASADLCSIMLPDSGHIQEMEVERKNRKARRTGRDLLTPIYTVDDALECIKLFEECNYNEPLQLFQEMKVTFRDAGHMMGSAFIEIEVDGTDKKKLVFSGDLGRAGQNIINDPELVQNTDYLLIETTYGNRLHTETVNRKQKLAEIILNTFKKGGNVIIPAFAVERTQDLLYDLNSLINEGVLKQGTIIIDSPLAISATEVFGRHPETYDQETREFYKTKGYLPFLPEKLRFTRTPEESRAINDIRSGAIIISANGMAEAGRIRHHLKHNLWKPESSIIFIGYQAEGSLGRRLLDGVPTVRIFGEEINVKAEIFEIDAYSGHADYNEILAWLKKFKSAPKKVFLVHGEASAAESIQELIKENFSWETAIPGLLDYYDFSSDELVKSALEVTDDTYKACKAPQQDFYRALDHIQNILDKAVNKKFNQDQYRNVLAEMAQLRKMVGKIGENSSK